MLLSTLRAIITSYYFQQGVSVQKHWYTVKTVDEEDFMLLTIVMPQN